MRLKQSLSLTENYLAKRGSMPILRGRSVAGRLAGKRKGANGIRGGNLKERMRLCDGDQAGDQGVWVEAACNLGDRDWGTFRPPPVRHGWVSQDIDEGRQG